MTVTETEAAYPTQVEGEAHLQTRPAGEGNKDGGSDDREEVLIVDGAVRACG